MALAYSSLKPGWAVPVSLFGDPVSVWLIYPHIGLSELSDPQACTMEQCETAVSWVTVWVLNPRY